MVNPRLGVWIEAKQGWDIASASQRLNGGDKKNQGTNAESPSFVFCNMMCPKP